MIFSEKQIADYKAKFGKIWLFNCKSDPEKSCILHKAGRNELSLANMSAISRNDDGSTNFDVQKFNESILISTWVDGDEVIKTDDALFLGIANELSIVIEKSTFEVKEL